MRVLKQAETKKGCKMTPLLQTYKTHRQSTFGKKKILRLLLACLLAGGSLGGDIRAASSAEEEKSDPESYEQAQPGWHFDWRASYSYGGADAFYRFLDANRGRAVALSLTLTPRQDKEARGYTLTPLPRTDRKTGGKADDNRKRAREIVCGRDGLLGNIDNYQQDYQLTFNHPEHSHAPVTLRIGNRRDYPFQMIWCGVDNYTDNDFTSLHVNGYFVIMSAPIPTAIAYDLYPVHPGR